MSSKVRCFLLHFYLLIQFFIIAFAIKLFSPNPITRRRRMIRNIYHTARQYKKAFQIELDIAHPERIASLDVTNFLVVANHVSYLDIIILSSLHPMVFVTSTEMAANPILGDITRLGGCLFTDRKKHTSLPQEIENFSQALKNGFNVCLFPEGTSTNGNSIREFRKSLFQMAVLAKVPVQPVCIRYTGLDGAPISPDNRDLLYWYGDMTFAPHFMKLLGRKIKAEVHFLDPIPWQEGNNRQAISDNAYSQIYNCFHQATLE